MHRHVESDGEAHAHQGGPLRHGRGNAERYGAPPLTWGYRSAPAGASPAAGAVMAVKLFPCRFPCGAADLA